MLRRLPILIWPVSRLTHPGVEAGSRYARAAGHGTAHLVPGDPRQGTCPRQDTAGQPGRADRAELALAMAADTVAAALACPEVGRVIVVTDDPQAAEVLAGLGAVVVPDRAGRRAQRGAAPRGRARRVPLAGSGIGGLAADLPALRPAELSVRCGRRRDGRRRSCRTPPGPGPRCTPCGRGPRSGRGSGRGRPPGTGRPGRPRSPGPAWPACAGTWTSRRTCAGRGNWGWAPHRGGRRAAGLRARGRAARMKGRAVRGARIRCGRWGRSASW